MLIRFNESANGVKYFVGECSRIDFFAFQIFTLYAPGICYLLPAS